MTPSDELVDVLKEAKKLAARYYRITKKPLGIAGEVAEFEAGRLLGLKLFAARKPGADAEDDEGRLYQIKGRVVQPGKAIGRTSKLNLKHPWDYCLLVVMDSELDAVEIWKAPRAALKQEIERPGSKARNERKTLAFNQFRRVATRVWPAARPTHR